MSRSNSQLTMHASHGRLQVGALRSPSLPGWARWCMALGFALLLGACSQTAGLKWPFFSAEATLAPMFVADLGVDITVPDVEAALRQMDFVQGLDGYIAAVGLPGQNDTRSLTVELRVPHRYTGRVAEILSTEFGEVTFINVLPGEVSVRHARLERQLAAAERSAKGLSGTDLVKAKEQIDLLYDILAFQLKRTQYLYVVVRLVQAP
jgi:hypothetical protein